MHVNCLLVVHIATPLLHEHWKHVQFWNWCGFLLHFLWLLLVEDYSRNVRIQRLWLRNRLLLGLDVLTVGKSFRPVKQEVVFVNTDGVVRGIGALFYWLRKLLKIDLFEDWLEIVVEFFAEALREHLLDVFVEDFLDFEAFPF